MEMDLQIVVRRTESTAIIELSGEVDAYTSARFRDMMIGVVNEGGVNLIISMLEVQYIDSSGLGALVGGLKRVSENNGQILVICDTHQIRKVFEITGLEKVFPIYATEEEALAALKVKP